MAADVGGGLALQRCLHTAGAHRELAGTGDAGVGFGDPGGGAEHRDFGGQHRIHRDQGARPGGCGGVGPAACAFADLFGQVLDQLLAAGQIGAPLRIVGQRLRERRAASAAPRCRRNACRRGRCGDRAPRRGPRRRRRCPWPAPRSAARAGRPHAGPGRTGCGAALARPHAGSTAGSPRRQWHRDDHGHRRRDGSRRRHRARRSTYRPPPADAWPDRRPGGRRWSPRPARRRGPRSWSARRPRCRGGWPWGTAAGAGRPRRWTGRGGFRRCRGSARRRGAGGSACPSRRCGRCPWCRGRRRSNPVRSRWWPHSPA